MSTGLDPSTIYFEGGDTATRLDPTDALLVDIVHTDATFSSLGRDHVGLGFKSNLGNSNWAFRRMLIERYNFKFSYASLKVMSM